MNVSHVVVLCAIAFSTVLAMFFSSYMESRMTAQVPHFLSLIRDRTICNVKEMLDAVTGSSFEMTKKRSYSGVRLQKEDLVRKEKHHVDGLVCKSWAVITSVNSPTVVVRQLAETEEDLCVVVVADKKSPIEYNVTRAHLVYLTVEDQEKLDYNIMKLVPWNHFARKNVGFLYAIQHGAKRIFDLDDDNELISEKNIMDQVFRKNKKTFKFVNTTQYVTNPYMIYLNKEGEYIWPRGYPLEAIKTPHDYSYIDEDPSKKSSLVNKIGVIQYLQNVNPDLDAIYRITSTIPSTFDPSITYCIILKKTSFSPWNAQSTVFEYETFWGMLLPMTVHGRVSDIWRSYFTQRVMWERDKYMAFCPSIVNHIRNQHRLIKDFDAEMPLYTQTEAMLKFLNEWTPSAQEVPEILEELYVEMYERGIVELRDVEFIQAWIRDLVQIGYRF